MATAKKAPTPKAPGTAVAKRASNAGALVDIKAQLQQQIEDLANRVAPATGNAISVKGKVFKTPDGDTADSMEVVIVDFVAIKNFYEGAYDADNIVPPTCFAISTNPMNMVPSDNSPVKQAPECKGCPMNEFGSAGKGKACKDGRRLAVLPPDATADTPLWTISVSPTAIKAFDAYVRSVASVFKMPPVAVVTTLTFDDSVDYPSLRFGDPQPNENLEACFARQNEAREMLTTEPDVSQYAAAAPVKKVAAKRPAMRR